MTSTTTKKVVIIGSALSGNKGAAAMLESSMQALNAKFDGDVEFTLLSMYPTEDSQQNTYKNLSIVDATPAKLGVVINSQALIYKVLPFLRGYIKSKSQAIAALADADVLLDEGGITFVDGREKFLLYNVASILPAMMVGTPVFKCAQALGPFKNPINRVVSKIFLPRVKTIVSRGAITHSYLDELKLSNVTKGADYAFTLNLTPEEIASAGSKFKVPFGKDDVIVGVSPSVVMKKKVDASGGDYQKRIVNFINYLTDNGYKVMLVPHSVRLNTDKTHNNDLPLCNEIYQTIKSQKDCMFLDKELSSQELRFWIGECNIFVASRFHAMISSLAMSVPTLVIGWSHKYREVLGMFDLEEWAFGQDKLSDEYLAQRFEDLVKDQTAVHAKLSQHLPDVNKLSAHQTDLIVDVINGK